MKICIISSIFPPYSRGGAEMVVETTARIFAQGGHEVMVITCAPFEGGKSLAGRWEECKIKNVECKIFRFTPLNLFTYFSISKHPPLLRLVWHVLDMFNLHTYLVVRRILREEKPDLIVTRNLKGLGYTVAAAIRGMRHEARSMKWFHGLHDLGALHPRGFMEWGKEAAIRKPVLPVRLYRAVARRLFGSPDAIIAPSQFVLGEYERAGFFAKSKKVVVRNPVTPRRGPGSTVSQLQGSSSGLRPADAPNAARPHRRDHSAPLRFLFFGQLEPYKGLRVLLQVWKKFIVDHPEARLEIAGAGSLEKEVQRAAKMIKGIRYYGFIAHDQLSELMSGARATILPSLAYETFGLTIVESFAAGIPVIASRIGAIPEIVKDRVNGILVTPGDAGGLVQALTRMIGNEWNTLSQGAVNSAKNYSPDVYYNSMLELYNSVETR